MKSDNGLKSSLVENYKNIINLLQEELNIDYKDCVNKLKMVINIENYKADMSNFIDYSYFHERIDVFYDCSESFPFLVIENSYLVIELKVPAITKERFSKQIPPRITISEQVFNEYYLEYKLFKREYYRIFRPHLKNKEMREFIDNHVYFPLYCVIRNNNNGPDPSFVIFEGFMKIGFKNLVFLFEYFDMAGLFMCITDVLNDDEDNRLRGDEITLQMYTYLLFHRQFIEDFFRFLSFTGIRKLS